jgi:hypothetical protein
MAKISIYPITQIGYSIYPVIKDPSLFSIYFTTTSSFSIYPVTVDNKKYSIYFSTKGGKSIYFTTPDYDSEDWEGCCEYPTELERIREDAVTLSWEIIESKLYASTNKESYGKVDLYGYNVAGELRILLDYLSSIWIEKRDDAASGLVRTATYYWDKYSLDEIIITFRKCDVNIKEIVALFNLKTYEVIDGEWPNYEMMEAIINPPTAETTLTLKQYTDIFTNQEVLTVPNQSVHGLSAAQTNFVVDKKIKYFSDITINGNSYIGFASYSNFTVTYSPSILDGYTIAETDLVAITYWYEE